MEINLILIKISWFKTILRPLNLIVIFLPVFLSDKIDLVLGSKFWGIWTIFWLIVFFLQLGILKRYKRIGLISLSVDTIRITNNNLITNLFSTDEKLTIIIEYNGYKGELGKYKYPLQLPLLTREGIGSIRIMKENKTYKFNHLCLKDISKKLTTLSKILEQKGNVITVMWS